MIPSQVKSQAKQSRYSCALVTGASSGLGAEYARQLAASCANLIVVARRKDLLQKLSEEISISSPHVKVHCLEIDLTQAEGRIELKKTCEKMSLQPDLLVNNAGLGDYGDFTGAEWEKLDSMLQVNVTALTHLCHLFLPAMIVSSDRSERSAIVNISSLASTLPIPDFAVYAATKAYVSSFSEALRMELREFNIPVLAVCPGPVRTNFGKIAMRDQERGSLPAREGFYVPAEQVVADSIIALHADCARVYPGWKIALLAAGISLLPMLLVRPLVMSRRGKL